MTNKETVHRNLSLVFDFVKHLIETPGMISKLPDNSVLSFLDKDIDSQNGNHLKSAGKHRSFVKVRNAFEISK